MIPHRIKLAGFLSYKGEQEVVFSTAPLWLLAGTNGSGKSSVFDAVTYALFGAHRGGTQNAGELINKESSQLAVEFDFHLAGEMIRAKRTLKKDAKGKASGTQQLFRQSAVGKWDAIEGTGLKDGFVGWIKDHIGLNYETFTSSVLLLQGKAEKLLDSAPKGRAEVLAQIVDLERYQKLHERANNKKLALKSKLEALSQVQSAVPEVGDVEYAEAMLAVEGRTDDQIEARGALDAAQNAEREAHRHADAQVRLAAASARLAAAEALLGDAGKIEELAARLRDLSAALPAVGLVMRLRADKTSSGEKSVDTQRQKDEAATRKKGAEHLATMTLKKRDAAAAELATAETDLRDVLERLPTVTGLLEKVKQAEATSARLKALTHERTELGDPHPAAESARAEVERLGDLNSALPLLEQFSTDRHALTVARRLADETGAKLKDMTARGQKLRAEADAAKQAAAAAREAQSTARAKLAGAGVLVEQAELAVQDLGTAGRGAACKACGQPLTKEHRAAEKTRREQAAADARAVRDADRAAVVAADRSLHESHALDVELTEQVVKLREDYQKLNAAQRQAEADTGRFQESLGLRFAQLSAAYQAKITRPADDDWAATSYPERDELVTLRRNANRLAAARTDWKAAEAKVAQVARLSTQIDTLGDTLAGLHAGLNGAAPAALKQEHLDLTTRKLAAEESATAGRGARARLDAELQTARNNIHEADALVAKLQNRLDIEHQRRDGFAQQETNALAALPADWQTKLKTAGLADHARWQGELDQLNRDGIPQREKQLAEARGGLAGLEADVSGYAAECAAFPESARVSVPEAQAHARTARDRLSGVDGELAAARQKLVTFDKYRADRDRLGGELMTLAGAYTRHETLADLLGRNRLQRFLVRQAERQIVEYANGVLDRLSGGQLYMRLVGGDDGAETDRALDLECCNRITGGAAINVAFLSGSQKFRVAVSLALAIGQYASKQHRPIESVIIDEGFGCLDRQGRQVMIQEFQNLREHLRCILLVSHQEEFADAFPDGYRFELHDGATQVARFQR